MVWVRRIWVRFKTLLHRNRSAQQLDDEIQFHLDHQVAENLAAGMSPREARYAAMRTFGNATLLKEETRDTWGWIVLERMGKDFRYAVRSLCSSPLFTLTVIFSLALGIGANTAIFTLLHASLWRPLGVSDPQEIFHLMRASSEGDFAGEFSYSYPLFQQFTKIASPWGEV
ncbi:MAG TPA: permease prefix domain 1-containing protein, partial [Candidatus Dormibacteraeota bacterium]|nr:permease prefix domain 1-containing protein [Candidatus Dormibacteraeota bacterium]